MQTNKWTRFGHLLLDNLENFLAILLCLVAGLYSLMGGKSADSWLLSAITGVLGLIAYGTIKDRKAREKLQKLAEGLAKKPTATELLRDRTGYQPFDKSSESAQEVCLVGASLVNFLGTYEDHLRGIIKQYGAVVKIIILDETSPVIESAAKCLGTQRDDICIEIVRTGQIVESIVSGCRGSKGSIQLRKLAAFPNCGMAIIDARKPIGTMTIEFNGYKEETSCLPHLELTREADPVWFARYVDEFNRMWEESVPSIPKSMKTRRKATDQN